MPKPAVWNAEPDCGHDVTHEHQTHYCTYIRVPRLLELQTPRAPDDLLLITAHQWHELWFKVLLTDLHAMVADGGRTHTPVKFLRRGVELFRLFDIHGDLAETVAVQDLRLSQPIRDFADLATSGQFAQLMALERDLPRLARHSAAGPVLAEAVREYRSRFKAFRARYQKFLRATLKLEPRAPTYADWLRLPELLALQTGPRAGWAEPGQPPSALMEPEFVDADETMFIIVHQCFEIWFKVMLDQIDRALPLLQNGRVDDATRLMRRVLLIQRLLVPQIQIPATMQPLDFLRFREQKQERDGRVYRTGLSPASGTESYQFREIEIVCGLRDDAIFQKYLAGSDQLPIRLLTPRQRERLTQPTVPEAFRTAVQQRGLPNLDALFAPSNPHTDLAQLADVLIDFDDFFRFWRLNHVSVVQKMIGTKSGTGFLGPEYLMETAGLQIQEKNRIFEERQTRPRFFEDLWAVRSRLGGN